MTSLKNRYFAPVLLLLPFIIFYWMVPVFSDLTIGNDYGTFSIQQQLEVAYSFEHESFPLYAPGFAGGQSAAALTLGQAYHPISHIAPLLPGYWEGDALKINTVLRLFSLGLCHLLFFYLLRRLGLNTVASLVLSIITVYNLRMLDSFRYGASIENFTAFLALSSFVILRYLSPSSLLVKTGIVCSAYLLAVGGHPQVFYLGFLGAAIVTLIAPFFVSAMNPGVERSADYRIRYWIGVLVLVTVGALLAAPYLIGFYTDFVASNTMRAKNGYEWAAKYQDSWGGGLRNFYAPLKSDIHGGFGGSSLLLLVTTLPILVLYRSRIPLIILISIALCIVIFLVCIGDATPIHYTIWKFLPLADKFRVPGRFSLWIIFPLIFILAWLFKDGLKKSVSVTKNIKISSLTLVSVLAMVMFLVANLGFDNLFPNSSVWTPQQVNGFSNDVHDKVFYAGLVSLLLCAAYGVVSEQQNKLRNLISLFFVISVLAQVTLSMRYGTWVVVDKSQKTLTEMHREKQQIFKVSAVPGFGLTTDTVDVQLKRSIIDPKVARVYRNVVVVQDEEKMWEFMATERTAYDAVVLSETSLSLAGDDQDLTSIEPDKISLLEAHYNKMIFEISARNRSFVSTHMPFRKNWSATVDGKKVEIFRANGNETGVFMPAGTHSVIFSYESEETVFGSIVSGVTLLLALLFAARNLTGRSRISLIILAFLLPSGLFYLWYHSLYNGTPVATTYEWVSNDFSDKNNLAYGKGTASSQIHNEQMPFFFYSGLAVDGDISGRPFASVKSYRPSWSVDLGSTSKVDLVKIHGLESYSLPITVFVSNDQKKYQAVAKVSSPSDILEFELEGMELQFLAIRSENNSVLSFKEVEVIGTRLTN